MLAFRAVDKETPIVSTTDPLTFVVIAFRSWLWRYWHAGFTVDNHRCAPLFRVEHR
jgi:hypothetical protein